MAIQHSSSSLAWNCLYSPLVLPNPTSLLSITVATVSSHVLLTLHLLGNSFVLSSILKPASDVSPALRGLFSLFYPTLFDSCSHSVIAGNIDSRKILDLPRFSSSFTCGEFIKDIELCKIIVDA